ncbi:hypothetical protein P170DRAFT_253033 [Aspergillus steynii IBT 23096]|uniref:Uncharacterized protein n=1 Tax=Aspergillus steynii IBT 23096 TaxID=1392250 RepID=A0A2I2FYV1_9EURO|nr:uncharacterized protein P170DRAFT_253033 [Aspergillus steynii IBT 23096]PLB45821.1 hypothetical protein P170DRAFT_253033 [Aspergillus steynii IBT 23096]
MGYLGSNKTASTEAESKKGHGVRAVHVRAHLQCLYLEWCFFATELTVCPIKPGDAQYFTGLLTSRSPYKQLVYSSTAYRTKYALTTNDSSFIHGTVFVPEASVAVIWPFLTLPAVVLVLGFAFFYTTMFLNKKGQASLWKSSLLPLLFHGWLKTSMMISILPLARWSSKRGQSRSSCRL